MKVDILAFGITKDIVGGASFSIEIAENSTVAQLKEQLGVRYPDFKALASLAIAINNEYAQEDQLLNASDEIVLIPPVSGG